MSVPEMADLLGLKSGTAYDLVKRGYFETTLIDRRIRIITSSFEDGYQFPQHSHCSTQPAHCLHALR